MYINGKSPSEYNPNRLYQNIIRYFKTIIIVIYFKANIKKILKQGKDYHWPVITVCPVCDTESLVSHGFVKRYFLPYSKPIYMKRFRCTHCRSVHTLRPDPIYIIRQSIRLYISSKKQLPDIPRQRQTYWFKGFLRKFNRSKVVKERLRALLKMISQNKIIPTHSIKKFEIKSKSYPVHLSFSFTPECGFT
jgi:hypothetical protein